MTIKKLSLSSLNPASYNPRTIGPRAMAGLAKSIERFGLVEPIIWNKTTGNVVGGHQRLRVLLDNGETETDVVVVELDEIDEKALNISLNNPNIMGEFDHSLQDLLSELQPTDDYEVLLLKALEKDFDVLEIPDESDFLDEEDNQIKTTDDREVIVCPSCGCKWHKN